MLLQEEPPTTGLAVLIRCQRCSEPLAETTTNTALNGTQGLKLQTRVNTPASSAYGESQSGAATEKHPTRTTDAVDYFVQIGDGWQHMSSSTRS